MQLPKSLASRLIGCSLLGFGLNLLTSLNLAAGTFQSDFNSGIPLGMNLFGNTLAYDHSTGGVGGSGALHIVEAIGSQQGSAIIDDFDAGAPVGGFDATFDLYIGSGNGADGFAFFFGDFADAAHSEEGPGTINGLTIAFDVFNNGGTPAEAPAIDVKWNNVIVFHRLVGAAGATTPASPLGTATTIRTQPTTGGAAVYWPVKIHVDTDGTLDVVYNNIVVVTNFPLFRALTDAPVFGPSYRFGFSGRTGGSTDNHFVDNLVITTVAPDANSGQPFIRSIAQVPVGLNAGAAGGVAVELQDGTNGTVNPASVTLRYNNNLVTPAVAQDAGVTRIAYFGNNGILPVGAATVTIGYATTTTFTNFFSWNFVVDPFVTLPTNYALPSVDISQPGFKVRTHQFDSLQFIRAPGDGNLIVAAERHLALGYLDPATGLPYPNVADLTLVGTDGLFNVDGMINWNQDAPAAVGQFSVNSVPPREDQPIPGIPGTTFSTDNAAVEILTYIQLKAGGHRFGFNSDDGFRASFGPGWDAVGTTIVGSFNGGRGAGEGTFFDVVVPQDGFYPLRISYWEGGGGANAELLYFNPTNGQRVLVNDPDNLAAPRTYKASTVSRPSVTRALPVQNWIGAFPDDDVVIDITDGAIPLTGGSVSLLINNVAQTITQVKNGAVTTVTRDGSIDSLLPSGVNNVRLIYGFTESGNPVTVTNNYSFTVAPYYGVLPVANKVTSGVVTTDTGFRGLVDQIDKSGDANQGNGARINGGWDSNRMPFPEIELFGGNINPTNGLRYPNLAVQSSPGSWLYDPISPANLINWAFQATDPPTPANSGMFQSGAPAFPLPGGGHLEEGIPGLPGAGTSPNGNWRGAENYICEITTYLDLKRGVYVFGLNSDDGFVARSGPNVNDTLGTLLGFFNGGRGNSGNLVAPILTAGQTAPVVYPGVNSGSTIFSVIVQEDGIYPIRILYWQGGTGINTEFYSLNRTNGTVLLVGDTATDANAVPAYRTYTGPAKPYVKFSICPNPWDSPVQQIGPGPITMIGRTRNAVNSSDIYNLNNTAFPSRPWANTVIGGVIGNGTSSATLALLLNGTPVPATLTTNGTDVTVAYQPNPPLPPGSTNTASLIYAGTTNSWTFVVQNYATLNAGDAVALAAAAPDKRGFRVKMTQVAAIPAGVTQNSVARAENQILGFIGQDVAFPGTGPGGSHIYTNIINWNNNFQTNVAGVNFVPIGNFQPAGSYGAGTGWPFPYHVDEPLPGVPGTGRTNVDNCAAEVFAYLAFPAAGYYRLGVNGDDGFALKVGTPGQTNGLVLFTLDLGKGSSDVPVSFIVPAPGLYPIRLVYYNGGSGANLEFFSYDSNGAKIPINDWNNPNSIKAYFEVASNLPRITGTTITGGFITVTWVNGGTLESAPTVSGPWDSTGDADGSFTETATGGAKFYRARLQQ